MKPRLPDGILVGCPRSGTTLLQSIIACHLDVPSFSESHFYSISLGRFPKAPFTTRAEIRLNILESSCQKTKERPEMYVDVVAKLNLLILYKPTAAAQASIELLHFMNELARRPGKQVWLEKSPVHLRFLPLIERAAARGDTLVRIVHVVRDGRDVVASLYRRSRSKVWVDGPYTIHYWVERWNRDATASLKRISKGRSDLIVGYEALTDRPEATVARLFERLGLRWDHKMLSRRDVVARSLPHSARPHHRRLVGHIKRYSTFFENTFDPRERSWILGNLDFKTWSALCGRSECVARA